MIFDASSADALFDLDEDDAGQSSAPAAHDAGSDDFLSFEDIAPLEDAPLQIQAEAETQTALAAQPALDTAASAPQDGLFAAAPSAQAEHTLQQLADTASAAEQEASALMPQDILKLQPQALTGEWTVDKWEYWFRSSELSPALQELAQHGLMTGEIGGASIFHVPKQYERLVTQMQHVLEQALHAQWPATRFQVQYEELEQATPYDLQYKRKEKANQRASELLHDEPAVKSLLSAFDGKLENIQLK